MQYPKNLMKFSRISPQESWATLVSYIVLLVAPRESDVSWALEACRCLLCAVTEVCIIIEIGINSL